MFDKEVIKNLKLKSKSGIYHIINKKRNKVYIGSAINLTDRLFMHEVSLRQGYHINRYLQRSYNKNGCESFNVNILEFCLPEKLIEREQYYFDRYLFAQEYIASNGKDKRFNKVSYNISPVASSSLGTKMPEEVVEENRKRATALWQDEEFITKQKKVRTAEWNNKRTSSIWGEVGSEKRKEIGRKIAIKTKERMYRDGFVKPILQYDKYTGKFIKEYDSIMNAAREIDGSTDSKWMKRSIINNLKERSNHSHGFIFKYKEDDNYPLEIKPITSYYKSKESRNSISTKIKQKNSKNIEVYCKETHELLGTYLNAKEASKHYDITVESIRRSVRDGVLKTKPWYFKYKNAEVRTYNR